MKGLRVLFFGLNKTAPASLTEEEREQGRRLLKWFHTLNGISVACLMNNMLILYAIRNNIADAWVAVMASFIYLSMPFMLLGKPIVSRLGAARTRGLGWFLRYVSALIMLLGPVLAPFTSQAVVTAVILLGAFGFAFFRTIGITAANPLIGEVAEPDTRGQLLSILTMRNQITYLVTMALIILIVRYVDRLWIYQVIIGTGCVIGFHASAMISLVPESSAPRRSAQKSFSDIFRHLWNTDRERRLLFAWCAGTVSFSIVIPFMMIAVKNGYDVSDSAALIFGLILVLGTVASSFINRRIADVVGARRLVLLYMFGMILAAGSWVFIPGRFSPGLVGAMFFLAGFCSVGIGISLNQYFFDLVANTDRVGSALILHIASGAAAGLAGSVIGGGLLELLSYAGIQQLDAYRYYFLITLVLLGLLLLTTNRLTRGISKGARSA